MTFGSPADAAKFALFVFGCVLAGSCGFCFAVLFLVRNKADVGADLLLVLFAAGIAVPLTTAGLYWNTGTLMLSGAFMAAAALAATSRARHWLRGLLRRPA